MSPDTKRRLLIFGTGLLVGSLLSILLFKYADFVEGPRSTEKVEVVLTRCDLAPGDVFEEKCVEKRVVAAQHTPPDVVTSDQVGLWVGRTVAVKLNSGSAVRTVDFEEE